MGLKQLHITLFLGAIVLFISCDKVEQPNKYHTKNVVVIVVDGLRNDEGWGDPLHQYIPHLKTDLAPEGVVLKNFRNNGPTYTNAGHTAILTGHYQTINNAGIEKPFYPNYLNYWRKNKNQPKTSAWFITSKDKIQTLGDYQENGSDWEGDYLPSFDCGINGFGYGYRADSITVQHVLDTMERYKPTLVFINLREPDFTAHTGNWENYLAAITQVDKDYYAIWQYLQNSAHYKNNTTLFITNDHGRHTDEYGGFANHGDNCEGCRHINLFAYGPDFKKNVILENAYEQIDISKTISELLQLNMQTSDGKVMEDLFK